MVCSLVRICHGTPSTGSVNVMFLEPRHLIADVDVVHGMGAQVERVEVIGGVAGAIGLTGIVDRGGVEMAVAGKDGELRQAGPRGQRVSYGAGHEGTERGIGLAAEAQAAAAGRGIEERAAGGHAGPVGADGLEEGAAAGLVLQHAGDAEVEP